MIASITEENGVYFTNKQELVENILFTGRYKKDGSTIVSSDLRGYWIALAVKTNNEGFTDKDFHKAISPLKRDYANESEWFEKDSELHLSNLKKFIRGEKPTQMILASQIHHDFQKLNKEY